MLEVLDDSGVHAVHHMLSIAARAGEGPGPIDPEMLRASHAAAQQQQQRKEYVAKQQRWLLFLRHCAKCQARRPRLLPIGQTRRWLSSCRS